VRGSTIIGCYVSGGSNMAEGSVGEAGGLLGGVTNGSTVVAC